MNSRHPDSPVIFDPSLARRPAIGFAAFDPTTPLKWRDVPMDSIEPPGDRVHLWWIDLDALVNTTAEDLLGLDEKAQAVRFSATHDRHRFIARRGVLRQILSSYLAISPSAISYRHGDHGKPALAHPGGIEFNVSHREGRALIAVAHGRPVGVDLEWTPGPVEIDAVSEQFFSGAERVILDASPPASRHETFYRLWTRREAVLKAHGVGLAMGSVPLPRRFGERGLRSQIAPLKSQIQTPPYPIPLPGVPGCGDEADPFAALAQACEIHEFSPADAWVASLAIGLRSDAESWSTP